MVTTPLRMEPLMALLPVVVVVELVAKSPQGGLEGLTETLEEVLIIPLAQEPLEVGVEQEEQEAMQVPQSLPGLVAQEQLVQSQDRL